MYITNKERIVMTMKQRHYDIVVVGTGASGLFTALSLPSHIRVLMITKDSIDHSDSYLAQGGICVLKSPDDFDSYFEDTMRAGHYENNKEAVKIMIESSPEIIEDLIGFGVAFERDENGNLLYTREGAHSNYRILYHEDVTGKEITSTLIQQVIDRPNITILDYTTMIDLIVKENTCYGIIAEEKDGSQEAMIAKSTVLATGGIGGLFENSTNFPHITGDSFSLALKHQIELENLHYIQIHPTTLYSKKKGRRFLISESVRGEGAILLNENHERFTDELKPRDVVTSAIKAEMERFGTDHVYLTLPSMTKEEAKHRFPNIYQECLEEGYDLTKDLVPVTPSQHYLMGGIKASINGETSMKQLYAVGETACNGVHGANRLASNSLLESLVFAKRAAKFIAKQVQTLSFRCPLTLPSIYPDEQSRAMENLQLIEKELQRKDPIFYEKWCHFSSESR